MTIDQMMKSAQAATEEAIKAEALANYYDDLHGTRAEAEQKAFMALDKIASLAVRAQHLEDLLRAAEAKLRDAIDAENV